MAQQLSLPLPRRPALGRDDFYVSPANAAVLTVVEGWADWPHGRLAVVGPHGSGKTHLAHVFAAATGARVVDGTDLEADRANDLASGPLAIDRADQVGDEPALFHIYNLMGERAHPLLLTAMAAPARWNFQLPDLVSRLGTIPVATIAAPDDLLLTAVLAKHFGDRGIAPPPKLIPYLVQRIERSLSAAAIVVDRLDRRSLAEGRPIGIRLASDVLDNPPSRSA